MKKTYLLFLFVVLSTLSNAQSLKGELEGIRFWNTGKEVMILGYDRTSGTKFKAALYDEKLNLIKEYSKNINAEINIAKSSMYVIGDFIEIVMSTESGEVSFTLSRQLEEDREHKAEQNSSINRVLLTLTNYSYADLSTDEKYKRSISGTTLCNNGKESFSIKSKKEKKKPLGQDYICCTDNKSLIISFDIKVDSPDSTQNFFVSSGYYDKETENLIVVGTLYQPGMKVRMNSLGIVVYDKDGHFIKSVKIKLPECKSQKVLGWNYDDKSILIRKIGKTPEGNYFIHTENGILEGYQKTQMESAFDFIPLGYAFYEFNAKLDILKNEFEEVKNVRSRNEVYNNSSNDGKIILLSNTDKNLKKVEYINFALPEGSRTIELDTFSFKTNTNFNYNPNYDGDFFEQTFIANHVVTFHKFPSSNLFELKSFVIQ